MPFLTRHRWGSTFLRLVYADAVALFLIFYVLLDDTEHPLLLATIGFAWYAIGLIEWFLAKNRMEL